jgi:thiamine pyrophosphokinase
MVISGLNGRLDQTFQNLNLMYKYAGRFKISLMDEHSLLTMINKGKTCYIPNFSWEDKKGCGFFSLESNCLKTEGFKWNVSEKDNILFGTYISSSN